MDTAITCLHQASFTFTETEMIAVMSICQKPYDFQQCSSREICRFFQKKCAKVQERGSQNKSNLCHACGWV